MTSIDTAILLFLPTHREMSRGGAAYEAGYRRLIEKNLFLAAAPGLPILLVCDEASRWARSFSVALCEHQLHLLPLVGATPESRRLAALRGAATLGYQRLVCLYTNVINLRPAPLQQALDALTRRQASVGMTQEDTPYLLAGEITQLLSQGQEEAPLRLPDALSFTLHSKLCFAFFSSLSSREQRLAAALCSLLETRAATRPTPLRIEEREPCCRGQAARAPPR